MKEIIPHGIPLHNFFKIAVPPSWVHVPIDPTEEPITATLEDPKTFEKTKVEVIDMWTFTLEEFRRLNSFSLESYGLPAAKMETILRARYPEIDQKNIVRFVLLKKL